ncbi:hypothetical protein OROHE_000058 [Orobanche hederae]
MKVVSVAFDSGLGSVWLIWWSGGPIKITIIATEIRAATISSEEGPVRFRIVKIYDGFEKFRLELRVGKICLWFPVGGRCSTGIGSSNS